MSVLRQVEAVRKHLGIWQRKTHTVLQFSGADAGTWLQAQTSNDVLALRSGEGCMNALLDRHGRVQALFSTHRWEDEWWLLIEATQVPAIRQRLETHLFMEEVQVEEVGSDTPQVLVEGPRAHVLLARLLEEEAQTPGGAEPVLQRLPDLPHSFAPLRLLGVETLAFRQTVSGEDGYLILPDPAQADGLYAALLDRGQDCFAQPIEAPAQRALQFEGGLGCFGPDLDAEILISETPYTATAVSYDKGCFLGQEVVQRLRSYGAPKRALMGLRIPQADTVLPEPLSPLMEAGQRIGQMRSILWSPLEGAWLAYAYLDRQHRTPGQRLQLSSVDGPVFEATVTVLPFRTPPSREAVAQTLYGEALNAFEADAKDEDTTAIELLQEAILLQPAFEDAYEALGVILHRHGRVDEAIGIMQRLERLNPNSVMAHTNLSVLYVAKGMIQEAEAEKAKAEHLQLRKQLDTRAAEQSAAAERAHIRAEAEARVGMFREVLELDPEDPVALMGLGKCYLQLEQFGEAAPLFAAATRARKDYSAAYLEWGKCLEVLGKPQEAAEVYGQGIEAAGRKGDLMPLREMERRLKQVR